MSELFSELTVSSHVLDTTIGLPAPGISVTLLQNVNGIWQNMGQAITNEDGRISTWDNFLAPLPQPSDYQLIFALEAYFGAQGKSSFYPQVCIYFKADGSKAHLHIPLLLSAYSYSTYRGS